MVLVIAGLLLGLVAFNAMPGPRKALESEAQRLALLFQLARDEAIVRNRPIAFEADADSYRFLIRDDDQWEALSQDDLLREREFQRAPVALSVSPVVVAAQTEPLRLVFGREPVDKPFVLTMSSGNASVAIRADGIGHFEVQ